MKILILSDDFPPKSFGGAGIVALGQAKELLKRGHDLLVITATEDKKAIGRSEYEGLQVHAVYTKYPKRLRSYYSLYNHDTARSIEYIIKTFGPDVVHAHNIHQFLSYHSLEISRRYARKVFLTAHDAMLVHYGKVYPRKNYHISWTEHLRYYWREWNPLRNVIIKRYLRNVDRILVVSSALQKVLMQNGIKNTLVLHNGINVNDFSVGEGDIAEFKRQYGLIGRRALLFAGRLGRAKGGDIAKNLIHEVNKAIPEAVLLVAGIADGNVKEGGNIIFTGWLDRHKMSAAYGACDAVLSLSTYIDPFPTVNLEAMALGKPVIGTCFGGTSEAVKDGVTGFIVDPRNLEELRSKALRLLHDRVLSEEMGVAGRMRVEKVFQLSKQTDRLEGIYKDE